MTKERNRLIPVVAITAGCTTCGRESYPVVLAYDQDTHSEGLWCVRCYRDHTERIPIPHHQEGRA